MRQLSILCTTLGLGVAASTACSANDNTDTYVVTGGTGNAAGAGTGGSGNGTSTGGSSGSGGTISVDAGNVGGSGNGPAACDDQGVADFDNDGFTVAEGDCNNCDANANPGAYDTIGNNVDEDCNGTPDDTITDCDTAIPDVGYADPLAGAQALGICHAATPGDRKWGVLEAKYVMADGTGAPNPLSYGLLTGFGPNVNVQHGVRMLALSSGTARQPTDPGWQDVGGAQMGTTSTTPPGFPIDSPSCTVQTANDTEANDPAAFEVKIRVPTNAKSFKFNFNFYTYEWPSFVCSIFNDFFVALQTPAPPNAQFNNISFDSQGNPVSVNNGFLEVCDPAEGALNPGGKNFPCTLGPSQLQGTGFEYDGYEGHAATGWLETQSPVDPGSEITLRFAVWDMGDHVLDSTVLIDNFQFSAEEATEAGTKPVPVPR